VGFALNIARRWSGSEARKVSTRVKRDDHAVAQEYNPYLTARREWDERYGDLVTRAKNWRSMAMACACIALLSTGGVVWLSARSRVVPFVIAIDSLGRPVASGTAEQTTIDDDRLKRASILNWVENLRMVSTDGVAQRKAIDRVYSHIANGSHAQTFISEFYHNDPPFQRAQSSTVAVEIKSVLPTSERTYEVEWVETTRDLYGSVKSTDRWKASLQIALNPPKDERQSRMNPLGIYVTQASWARVL
jgi:type IV secretion system protein VirB5